MLVLYGSAKSRASRSLIALEEMGLAYEHRPVHPARAGDRETIMRFNPNGRIPVLDDDGLVIWESMAINLYLGDRYGGPLWPQSAAGRGRLYQWSLWAQTAIDVPARHGSRFGSDPVAKARAEAERLAALAVLDAALEPRCYLLGESFTLADLNLAATLSEPGENGLVDGDLDPRLHDLPNLADWLARCTARPSWSRVALKP